MSRKSKAAEFNGEGYNISVTGRNVQVTDSMKDYVIEKLSKVERLSPRIIDVNVTMDIQRFEHRVEITLRVDHIKINSQASCGDMYASIDRAIHKLEAQLRKYRERIRNHQAKNVSTIDMNVNVVRPAVEEELQEINGEIEENAEKELLKAYKPHEVVAKEKRPLKILTQEEAVMKMELSNDAFLIYRNERDMKLKVIYRRNDGNFGIIETES